MKKEKAIEYIGHYVDDCLSNHKQPVTDKTKLVGFQCGFEPMFVAVNSGYGWEVDSSAAEELAIDYLNKIGWSDDPELSADYIL